MVVRRTVIGRGGGRGRNDDGIDPVTDPEDKEKVCPFCGGGGGGGVFFWRGITTEFTTGCYYCRWRKSKWRLKEMVLERQIKSI